MKIRVSFNMATCARTVQECERAGFGQFNTGTVLDTGPGPEGETAQQAYKRWSASVAPGARLNPFYLRIEQVPEVDGITIGTRVKYAAKFLRSVGLYTGPLALASGEVVGLAQLSPGCVLADIRWEKGRGDNIAPDRVNVKNLVRADRVHLEPA